jgi:hypothetical protein
MIRITVAGDNFAKDLENGLSGARTNKRDRGGAEACGWPNMRSTAVLRPSFNSRRAALKPPSWLYRRFSIIFLLRFKAGF